MPQKIIKETLGELRSQSTQLDNTESSHRLESLVASIETSGGLREKRHGLIEEIRSAIEHFEVEHPRIAEDLNRILIALSNMGI